MNSESAFTPPICPHGPGDWIFAEEGRRWLECEVLPPWLPGRRWFGGKSRVISAVNVEAVVPVLDAHCVFIVRVEYVSAPAERYAVPLGWGVSETGVLARSGEFALHDAVFASQFRAALLEAMRTRVDSALGGEGSVLLDGLPRDVLRKSRVLGVEQSNTSIVYGERLFLKLFRRLEVGVNPDAEISQFLGVHGFAYTPPFAGALELRVDGQAMPFGLMLGLVENDGDAWAWALGELREHYTACAPVPRERIGLLGQRTAELHLALAAGEGADFAPESLAAEDLVQLAAGVTSRLDAVFAALRGRADDELVREVLAREGEVRAKFAVLAQSPTGGLKTRHHGDYHLGQVLASRGDWMIIDFEGEPLRPLAERRAKRSPLRDVAGMLRSFHYAAHAARPAEQPIAVAEAWCDAARAAFLERYFAVAEGAAFLPKVPADRDALLGAFVLEKALYEIDYELNNRPDWLAIPLRGLLVVL